MIIISDSSPLIALAIIEQLDLLEKLFREMYVPMAVYKEITKTDKPFANEFKMFLDGKTKSVKNEMAVKILLSDIGIGEAEAIVLSLEQNPDLVLIDDLKARKFAKMNGLNVIGTMGILLEAKNKGLIAEIKPYISKLLLNEIRISNRIIEITLEAAQEI